MKKFIIDILALTLLFSLCSCATVKSVPSNAAAFTLEVTEEGFESMEIVGSAGMYKKYQNESEMFEDADLVIIGMPSNTFTEEKTRYFDQQSNQLTVDDDWLYADTVRNIKVIEVLKGDPSLTDVELSQMAYVATYADSGKQYIRGLAPNEFIAKKNAKYIFYLKKDISGKIDSYYALPDQGVINIDGLDQNGLNHVSEERLKQAKEKYANSFHKYDRSKEIK